MSHRLIIRAQAEADITDAAVWYHNQRSGLGVEFLAEVQSAMEKIAANPRRYRRVRRVPEVRRVMTGRFPYRIFFGGAPMPSSSFAFFTHRASRSRMGKEISFIVSNRGN